MRTNSIGQYILSIILCLWLIAMTTSVAVAQDPMVPDPTNWRFFEDVGTQIAGKGTTWYPAYQAIQGMSAEPNLSGWSYISKDGVRYDYSYTPLAGWAAKVAAPYLGLWSGMFINTSLYYNWNYQRSWQYQAMPRVN